LFLHFAAAGPACRYPLPAYGRPSRRAIFPHGLLPAALQTGGSIES
jgi:hypothetical protein